MDGVALAVYGHTSRVGHSTRQGLSVALDMAVVHSNLVVAVDGGTERTRWEYEYNSALCAVTTWITTKKKESGFARTVKPTITVWGAPCVMIESKNCKRRLTLY